MALPILGLIIGLVIGTFLPVSMPIEYAKYLSVALLASLDSVFGGLRAGSEGVGAAQHEGHRQHARPE